ncbi:hypothetical protein [Xylella taiwanensis]|uniref:hypothetical protein n=1 Tax=Xylella taiwanensis TaxID=1444770 RepID=UPI003CCD596F
MSPIWAWRYLTGRDASGCNGGGNAQDVRLVALDHGLIDFSAAHGPQAYRDGRRIESVELFGRQIADARSKPVASNSACGKNMISEAACVDQLLWDITTGIRL